MKTHLITGGLLAIMLAVSSCTSKKEKATSDPFLPPLMGWSSWNTYHVDINEN